MAFTPATLKCIAQGSGGGDGPSHFHYTTTDAHTDVDATDYFTNGILYGMKLYDIVTVIDTDAPTMTDHYVNAVDSDGNVTISVSTLA